MTDKEKLENFITELIRFGEDEEELYFWRDIFDNLDSEEKQQLLRNLEKELTAARSV